MSSPVDQIKAKIDIVSLVGDYIKLEKSGSNFKARCPFHNEKTPSFFVSPDRGSFYCFGCGAKGDIFTFVENFEGLDFPGALKVLAERAGVTLSAFRPEERTDKEKLFSLMEQSTFCFEKNLSEDSGAKKYVRSRGIKDETIASFRLGYATSKWRELYDFLISKGAGSSDLLTAGLVKKKDGSEGFYDTFRSRIIFPIADSSGRIIAFSGRIFPEDPKGEKNTPKYLNSPETPIFRKSEVLYGLDKAKKEIRLRDYSILVEGQMDLVMLHQVGFTNTVASSGTALTSEHLVRLQRLSNRIIMAFDGDEAGFKAISRGAEIALSLGMEVKVAAMPQGSDPADMAMKDKEGLVEIVKHSQHIISFVLDSVVQSSSDSRTLARQIVSSVLPFVSRLTSASEQSHFIKEINQKTGIREDALWEDLKKVQISNIKNQSVETRPEKEKIERIDTILKKLVGILFWQKGLKESAVSYDDLKKQIEGIVGTTFLSDAIVSNEKVKDSLLFEIEAYYNSGNNLSSDITELVQNLAEEKLKKEFERTMMLLHKAETAKDTKEAAKLLALCQKISRELNEIKNKSNQGTK